MVLGLPQGRPFHFWDQGQGLTCGVGCEPSWDKFFGWTTQNLGASTPPPLSQFTVSTMPGVRTMGEDMASELAAAGIKQSWPKDQGDEKTIEQ